MTEPLNLRTRLKRVIATGSSPMNPKVKWAQLSCGHEIWRGRRPRIGATILCEKCRKDEAQP
jgi:hypothetical protein